MTGNRPRIPPLPREEWTDAAREVFAFWGEPGAWENGSKTNLVMVLSNHPALAMAYNAFGRHLLLESALPVRPRELIVLRVSWNLKCEYEWHYHVGYALSAGLTMDEIAAVGVGPDAPTWNEDDRAVLLAADELWKSSRVSDESWAALSARFDRHQVMDLVFTIGQYVMLSGAIAAFGVELEAGVDRIGWDLDTASGRPPGGRYRPREVDDWITRGDVTAG
jgi:4-carboxymuconolactone decarboxylase